MENREFKFRAFHTGANEMLYGEPKNVFTWHDEGQRVVIMQWTGLIDKNGVEIYEGDIIRAEGWKPEVMEVFFAEGAFVANRKHMHSVDLNQFYDSTGCSIEVIGNIHQNIILLQ